jgi:hypothetical protein
MLIKLILGCWGRSHMDFIMCPSVMNEIIDLTKNNNVNIEIKNYLDNDFKLFDKPLYNNVHTCIWNIQNKFGEKGKPIFQEILFRYIEEFCINHSKCGLYLKLKLEEM